MTAPRIKEALEPCPFCGGDAESDSQRHYRNISTGNLEKSAAIYCTKCNADMAWCYRDTPEIEREQVMLLLTEQWNSRATLSQPTADRREIVARVWKAEQDRYEIVAFSGNRPCRVECEGQVVFTGADADCETFIRTNCVTAILAALDGGADA